MKLSNNKLLNIQLELNDYAHSFAKARTMMRHHHFYLGPTNSGKAHNALEAFIKT